MEQKGKKVKKKYVILTQRVCNMGGAQLFVLRRSLHLINNGYEVHVVVYHHGDYFPLREMFYGISIHVVSEMKCRVAQYTRKKQECVLKELVNSLGTTGSYYVESHTLTAIEWGELLSAKLCARHLAYPLSEPHIYEYHFKPGVQIFKEKINKGEFYGCTSYSLREICGREDVPSNYVNIGFDENELLESSVPAIDYSRKEGDYIITTITRLDKRYIEPLVDAVAEMASKYPNQNFVLLIAGGCSDSNRENYLKNAYNSRKYGLDNLDIKYLGYIDKLGKDIFNISDLFVGMGTASINSISQRCITINIDPRNQMKFSSGFFGIDTNNFAYSDKCVFYSITEKIEEAYLLNKEGKRRIKVIGRKLFEEEFEMRACFHKLDEIINSLPVVEDNKYLKVSTLYCYLVIVAFWIKKHLTL